MTWNPSGPGQAGFEWPAVRQVGLRLNGSDRAAGVLVRSTVLETISSVQLRLSGVLGGSLQVEVFEDDDLPVTVDTFVYRPTAVSRDNNMETHAGSAISEALTDAVNDEERNLDTYVRPEQDGVDAAAGMVTYQSSDAANHSAPNAVRAVRVVGWCEFMDEANVDDIRLRIRAGTTDYDRLAGNLVGDTGPTLLSAEWTENPDTGERWTEADIQEFGTDNEIAGVASPNFGIDDTGGTFRCYQLWLEVDNVSVAPTASAPVVATQDGWATATLDGDWSKADATDYLVAVRRTGGEATLPGLTSGSGPPVGGSRALFTGGGGTIGAKGDLSDVAHPLVLVRSDAALSADSQPYVLLERLPVYAGEDVGVTVSLDGAARRNVRLVVARQSSATVEPLTVSLGGTQGTVEVADVADAVRKLREVTVVLDDTITPSGNTLITLTCPAPDGQGWEVVRLSTDGQHTSAAYGNGTDVPVLVTGAPDAVGGVAAT